MSTNPSQRKAADKGKAAKGSGRLTVIALVVILVPNGSHGFGGKDKRATTVVMSRAMASARHESPVATVRTRTSGERHHSRPDSSACETSTLRGTPSPSASRFATSRRGLTFPRSTSLT
jgi:hypothetical protein